MINRKEIKDQAKGHLKRNYWVVIFVALITLILANSYQDNDSYNVIYRSTESYNTILGTNFDITSDALHTIFGTTDIEDIQTMEHVTDGTFRVVFNMVTKFERLLFQATKSIVNIFDPAKAGVVVGIIIYGIQLLYRVFIAEPLLIGEGRFFLESRLYSKTKFTRMFYPFKKKRYLKAVRTGIRKQIYLFLWSLTIVGVVIKTYSYRMVNYIMADNPTLTSKEAILLSRKMMDGHKWEAFILDLSFIGWRILDGLTFGLFGVFYVNPYYRATDVEFYVRIKNHNNDEVWDEKLLENNDYLPSYPGSKERVKIDASSKFNYYKRYSLTSMILMFFSFSFVGFVWEVLVNFVQYGELVKKGTLMGPWLPIYGSGCVIVLLLLIPKKLKKITDNPMATFLLIMFICTVIEYGTSVYLEITKGMKWWDYTGFFMNINGRVCLEASLFFGIGGTACIYLIAPYLDRLFAKIPKKVRNIICIILVLLIAADFVHAHFYPNTSVALPTAIRLGRNL